MTNERLRKTIYTKLAAALALALMLAIVSVFDRGSMPITGMPGGTLAPGVVIDPGHGGYDGGAQWGDVLEKDINLEISLHLREILLAGGYRVAMTRYRDYSLVEQARTKKREDMIRRLAIIENKAPDLLIVVHCNSMASTRWSGGQIFSQHESEKGLELAKAIQDYFREFSATTRFASTLDHFLLRESNITGCLVEAGFISNAKDRELLQQSNYQRKIASAVWLGMEKYRHQQRQIEP